MSTARQARQASQPASVDLKGGWRCNLWAWEGTTGGGVDTRAGCEKARAGSKAATDICEFRYMRKSGPAPVRPCGCG